MPPSLASLLRRPALAGTVVRAGAGGLGRRVERVRATRFPGVPEPAHVGELVVLSGSPAPAWWLAGLLRGAVSGGASGVVAALSGRDLPGGILWEADRAQLPLATLAAGCEPRRVVDALRREVLAGLAADRAVAPWGVSGPETSRALALLAVLRADGRGDKCLERAGRVGWDIHRRLVVMALEVQGAGRGAAERGAGERGTERTGGGEASLEVVAAAVRRAVLQRDEGGAVAAAAGQVVVVLGAPGGGDDSTDDGSTDDRGSVSSLAGELAREAQAASREAVALGVSKICDGPHGLTAAFDQARWAVDRAVRSRRPVAVVHYGDLGTPRLLGMVADRGELATFAREVLGPLAGDEAEMRDPRVTLVALLECSLRMSATARRLGVHYNTVRYRAGRLERMLGSFRMDPALRLDLLVALEILDNQRLGRSLSRDPLPLPRRRSGTRGRHR